MSRRNAASFLFLSFLLCVCVIAGASEAPAPVQRDLWSRNDLRYERHWLVLGAIDGDLSKDPIAAAGGEAAMNPATGAAELLKGGKSLSWQSASSWSDEFTLTWPTGTPEFRGSQAASQVGYAFAKIVRDTDADVDVLFASTGPAHIWFNGGSDRSIGAYRRLAFDQDRLRVHLHRGENTVLIKSEHKSGPWSFALRIVAQGTVLPRPALAPAITSVTAASLTVSPDVGRHDRLPPVEVSVIAAGGRVIAHSTVLRGQDARFETGKWRDGAYEIRLQTPLPWNETETRHLDWYKGDSKAAADQVLAAAKVAPAGVEGDSIRMLADLISERVGGSLSQAADDGWSRIASPLMEYEELLLDRAGKQGSVRPYGFVRLAYADDVDGSTQFCRASLPPDYSASHASPLVLFLHGYNPPNPRYVGWWSVADRHSDIADHRKVIYVEPHGRGNTQYVGIGEQDVLRCLEKAKRRFNVDASRVYLTGESMGGSGTWIIGSSHPELFAAIAPTYGGWDYRLLPQSPFNNPKATRPLERLVQETQSSFAGAENLLNVPIFVHHGDQDAAVSVEFSRHAVRMLDRWGYDLRYQEIPGRGHEDLGLRDEIVGWLLTHRRESAPRHVRIRANDLRGASAHWVRVESWLEPLKTMEVEAEVLEPGVFRIDTKNVGAMTLSPPPELRGTGATPRVVWNGVEGGADFSGDGRGLVALASARPRPGDKSPELPGGLANFFTTPFAIVIGTSSPDERARRYCEQKGQALAQMWNAWQHQMPRVFHDTDVTAELEAKYSLLLIGGAAENSVTERLAAKIPLEVDSGSVTIDGHRFAATDAFVQMIHPSPAAPGRYVLVIAATSANGLYFWDPGVYWDPIFGFLTLRMDWSIVDGRRATLEPGLGADRAWVASGVFNRNWKLDDSGVFTGDEALRAASPLRHAPATAVSVPAARLDAFAGRYQVFPGFVLVIARAGNELTLTTPGSPAVPLVAENDNDFALAATANPLSFEFAADGRVSGLTVDFAGSANHATRVP